jgi:FkbM family methyltransferase
MSTGSIRVSLIKKVIDLTENLIFERRIRKFYRNEFSGKRIDTVIDVGANKGQSIDFFLNLNPAASIYALEPNPTLFQLLGRKYANHSNVKLFNLGVSDQSGEKLFFENVFDYTSSFEKLNEDSVYLKKKARILGVKPEEIITKQYPVNVTSLDDFITKEVKESSVDILKIDTEGHEFYCLNGLFNRGSRFPISYIQIENHNDDMYQNRIAYADIKSVLEKNNYFEEAVIPHGFSDLDEVVYKFRNH